MTTVKAVKRAKSMSRGSGGAFFPEVKDLSSLHYITLTHLVDTYPEQHTIAFHPAKSFEMKNVLTFREENIYHHGMVF